TQLAGQHVEGADAAVSEATGAGADLIVDVAGGEHRFGAAAQVRRVQAALDSALAVAEPLVYRWVHSKALVSGVHGVSVYSPYTAERPRVFEFPGIPDPRGAVKSAY